MNLALPELQKNKIVPIAFSTTDNYVPPLSVAIQSIIENCSAENEYHIFIMHQGVSAKNQGLLSNQVSSYKNVLLKFIDATEYLKDWTFQNLNFSLAAYFRFLIPYLLGEYENVIYLDCDIASITDIAKLLDYDYSAYVLGCAHRPIGAPNWAWVEAHAKGIDLKDQLTYFNSGVLVFNTGNFKVLVTQDKVLEMAATTTFMFPDQDLLNVLCEGKEVFFPMKWNVLTDEDIPNIHKELADEYLESKEAPCIIHYNADKPWKKKLDTSRAKVFWDYAARTPFFDTLTHILDENVKRAEETIDTETDECVFDSNNLRESELAESILLSNGFDVKVGHGFDNFAFNIFVPKADVETVLNVLTDAFQETGEHDEGIVV
jgi:lipopolysaccharide biosynthesis glycosyltransferase